MKMCLFILDFIIGIIGLGSFGVGLISHFRSDIDTRTSCIKIFAICVGLLVLIAVIATALGLPMSGFSFPKHR